MSTAAAAPAGTPASSGGAPASTGGAPASSGGAPASTGSGFTWGDGWRKYIAGEDADDLKRLERFQGPENIWKSYREIEKRMSAGELRPVLTKDARPEDVAAYRTAHGIPQKPEEYKINMAPGKEIPKEDEEFVKGFLAKAHGAHFTQQQVDLALSGFYEEVDRQQQLLGEAQADAERKCEDELRQIWGQDYRPNKAMIDAIISRAPTTAQEALKGAAKREPSFAQWLVQLEREINPAATVVPGVTGDPAKSVAQELAHLRSATMMGDPNSAYWKGPTAEANQARYRQLLEAEAKLAGKK